MVMFELLIMFAVKNRIDKDKSIIKSHKSLLSSLILFSS